MAEEKRKGDIEVYLTNELFNSLISILTIYIQADSENRYSQYAMKLKNKIMKYGREYLHDGVPNVIIKFFPEEAALLIKLMIMYANAIEEPSEDYFSLFHNNKLYGKEA